MILVVPMNSKPVSLVIFQMAEVAVTRVLQGNLGTPYRGNRFDYAHHKKECNFLLKGIVKWQDFH
jgi:hypothetical protein